jgi:hypothetical protein
VLYRKLVKELNWLCGNFTQELCCARCWWLTLIILATQEAEIRKITVQGQARQIVCKTLSQKYSTQNRAGGVAQEVEQLPSKCEALSSKVRP